MVWICVELNAEGWEEHDKPLYDQYLKNSPSETGYVGRAFALIRGNALRGESGPTTTRLSSLGVTSLSWTGRHSIRAS